MKYNRSVLWLSSLFILSILIRLPHLNRPLAKHHEFNSAVVLLGLESWKQGGGAQNFGFIPLLTYQNTADKLLQKGPYIDEKGNQIYLSFGPGWYVIPYIIFNTFNIPFTPLALQILNLFFLLASVLLLYRFVYYLFVKAGYEPFLPSIAACFVFLLNPSILWYLGNGYVCTGIALPFLIIILHYGTKMLYEHAEIKTRTMIVYMLAGICSIYIDWYGISFMAITAIGALLKIRQNKKYATLFVVSFITIILGVLIILFQFITYAGWQAVHDYWASRYIDRGLVNPSITNLQNVVKFLKHLITSFLPIILTLAFGFILARKTRFATKVPKIIKLPLAISLVSCLFDSAVFLNWAGEHEFAVIPYSIFLSILSAWIINVVAKKYVFRLALLTFLLTLTQYYYINFPGKYTAQGLPYDSYKKTGLAINELAATDERIFCNTSYMIYNFYAKRSFTYVHSYEEALKWASQYGIRKGVWIKIRETRDKIMIEEVKHFN